jgi:hypothetical protein
MSTQQFPIVKIDRTTGQEMLPLLIQKGIFSDFQNLPSKEDILNAEFARLGVESLTDEQKRQALALVGKYRSHNFIVRHYGNYQVGFGIANFSDENISSALGRVSLHKLGLRIAQIILAEVYAQRKTVDLVIPKERILRYLGYSSYEKQIYRQIDNVMFSLSNLNYYIHEYKTNTSGRVKCKEWGWFVYAVKADSKNYTLSVNHNFVGCIQAVINNEKGTNRDLSRGYYSFPTALLPASRDYSAPALLLANFLLLDSGNSKLNSGKSKIVAYSIGRLMETMKIENKRKNEAKDAFLDALEEVSIINKTQPSISELRRMKSPKFSEQIVRIYIPSDIEKLDDAIKSNLLDVK